MTQDTPEELPVEIMRRMLATPDWVLAALYSEWSQETYAATWMLDAEPYFVEEILSGQYIPAVEPADADGARIREYIEKALIERMGSL